MRIAVIVCSAGRPGALAALLPWLARQTLPPSQVVIVVPGPADLPPPEALTTALPLELVISEKGLPRQRNRGLAAVRGRAEAVLFCDDDYWPARDALAGIARSFRAFPDAAGVTGRLLADGIHSGGVSHAEAARLIGRHEAAPPARHAPVTALRRRLVGLYGCNMAFRAARLEGLQFDERLPLYGWQEDVDFAARVPGEKLQVDGFAGVHLGQGAGRETAGAALGYSQVANLVYLARKGSLPPRFAWRLMARNVAANHLRLLRPEPWIDRRGRARGNRAALRDLLAGRSAPERMLALADPA